LAFYKRTIFLINPAFQLKFSLIACSFILISTMIYPFIIMDFFNILKTQVPSIEENFANVQNNLIFYMILIQVVIVLLVFVVFIFFTHKIAGPLYKLKQHLEGIREGGPVAPLTFRNGDYFHDVAEEVNLFLEMINQNQQRDFEYNEEIAKYINNLANVLPEDKKPVMSEISRRLMDIKTRYNHP
jgi:hypothetical protein